MGEQRGRGKYDFPLYSSEWKMKGKKNYVNEVFHPSPQFVFLFKLRRK